MSKYHIYNDMDINIIRATKNPHQIVASACQLTQRKDIGGAMSSTKTKKLIKYLLDANHTSPFEHAVISLLIQNVSRSFLAQITRHRMGSFTSASQHYTKYSGFPNILSRNLLYTGDTVDNEMVKQHLDGCDSFYEYLISKGIPKEEARQVLPNAKAVNILWTVNARSLVNFFNQRLCLRNVEEMYTFACKLKLICFNWFPELFDFVGPDCVLLGGCTQGKMKAKECVENGKPNFKR